jgi:hypothetical protein
VHADYCLERRRDEPLDFGLNVWLNLNVLGQ